MVRNGVNTSESSAHTSGVCVCVCVCVFVCVDDCDSRPRAVRSKVEEQSRGCDLHFLGGLYS